MKYIGLVDVDKTSFPNLVLMKLATYYKEDAEKYHEQD